MNENPRGHHILSEAEETSAKNEIPDQTEQRGGANNEVPDQTARYHWADS